MTNQNNLLGQKRMARKKRWKCVGVISVLCMVSFAIVAAVYLGNYYHASTQAFDAVQSTHKVEVKKQSQGRYVFSPKQTSPEAGIIFYPGGKVEYEAYAPLMQSIAERGILCVLVHMPCNLAVLDKNAADGIQKEFPEIKEWYMGGHSLGGAMAASYVSTHVSDYKGLILLGAYSVTDLKNSQLKVLSMYGSQDKVMKREKYDANKKYLPGDFEEEIIEGGCHSYFGDYGHQKGDGKAAISRKEQIAVTADKIKEVVIS